MADAYLIETGGVAAGIVVLEKIGVRFYASEPQFYSIDGKTFANFSAVQQAVRALNQNSGKHARSLPETALKQPDMGPIQPAA